MASLISPQLISFPTSTLVVRLSQASQHSGRCLRGGIPEFILGTLVCFVVGAATLDLAHFIFLVQFLVPYKKILFLCHLQVMNPVITWQKLYANSGASEQFVSCRGSVYKGVHCRKRLFLWLPKTIYSLAPFGLCMCVTPPVTCTSSQVVAWTSTVAEIVTIFPLR